MIRLQDPMAFEAYVCLSPAEYISVRASGMATEIGLDSSCMQISELPPQGMIPLLQRDKQIENFSGMCRPHQTCFYTCVGNTTSKSRDQRFTVFEIPILYIHCKGKKIWIFLTHKLQLLYNFVDQTDTLSLLNVSFWIQLYSGYTSDYFSDYFYSMFMIFFCNNKKERFTTFGDLNHCSITPSS